MGVDYTGSGPLYAIGSGVIVNTTNSGWPGGTFIGLKLDQPIGGQQYVYYAENIAPNVRTGQRVNSGDVIGHARGSYPFIELGFAAAPGTGQTMAAATGQDATGLRSGDPGKFPTGFGVAMSDLIKSLGGPAGITTGPTQGSVPAIGSTPATLTASSSPISCGPALIAMVFFPIGLPVLWSLHAVRNRKERRRNFQGYQFADQESSRQVND